MGRNESEAFSVSQRGDGRPGSDPLRTVVWVRGEHDLTTRVLLAATIARAARLDEADIVVDLSAVTFLDATTIGALVFARSDLQAHSRALTVRAPTPQVRRLLGLCGLRGLIDEGTPLRPPPGTAIASWVDVPARDLDPDGAEPSVVEAAATLDSEPAKTRQAGASPVPVPQPRVPS